MLSLTLPYPPSANRYWRNVRGRMIVSPEAEQFKRLTFVAAKQTRLMPETEADMEVYVVLHPKKPKRVTGSPVRCIDLDNALKIALDALQGVAYVNDRQVCQISARRGEPVPGGKLVICWAAVKSTGN